MNTPTAIALAAHVAELTGLATQFQVRYGKLAELPANAPLNLYRQHHTLFEKQRAIASLLDTEVLLHPTPRWPWWKHQAAIDTATVGDLAHEVNHLIACCAYQEVRPTSELSPAIHSSQAAIAGMLHPEALLHALRRRQQAFALDMVLHDN